MPPQPLFRNYSHAPFRLTDDALSQRPDIAVAVAQCIAVWSTVELAFARNFVTLLGSNKKTGADMWNGLSSERSKLDGYRSVCLSSLPKEDCEIALAIIKPMKSNGAVRAKLAHWQWGYSDQVQDGLILIDPKALLLVQGRIGDAIASSEKLEPSVYGIPDRDVFMYRKKDLDDDLREFVALRTLITKLSYLITAPVAERSTLRAELAADARLGPYLSKWP